MTNYNGHSEDCLCVPCMMADMDAHVSAQGGTIHKVEKTEGETTGNRLAGQGAGNGTVRRISDAQVRFISKLIAERDTTNLHLLPGQFIDAAHIPTMGVKGGSALIEKLLACPVKPTAPKADAPSEKQIAFATTLIERKIGPATQAEAMRTLATLNRREVSEWINELKELPNLAAAAAKPKAEEVTEGMYRNPETGEIFKVQRAVHGSGNLYAKLLVVVEKGEAYFEYATGAIRKLRPEWKMNLDQAKEYGAIYGVCIRCSRTLTKEESIERAMGDKCASYF